MHKMQLEVLIIMSTHYVAEGPSALGPLPVASGSPAVNTVSALQDDSWDAEEIN